MTLRAAAASPSRRESRAGPVGYVLHCFPQITLTFVTREIAALRELGLDVRTFSVFRAPRRQSEESREFRASTFYASPTRWIHSSVEILAVFARNPRRFLAATAFALTRPGIGWRGRLRTLGHFLEAALLVREMQRQGVRHVHAHFAHHAASVGLFATRLVGARFSFTAHANDLFANPILLPEKLAEAAFAVTISEYNARALRQLAPDPRAAARIHVVRSGLDVERFAPRDRSDCDPPWILCVGRLVEKKGHRDLLRACRILASTGPNFRCVIAGEGPERGVLQAYLEEHDLLGAVELLGPVLQEELLALLRRATVFALPCVVAADGDRDGIPVALIEAMACGIAVVSTGVSGIPELVEHGGTGLLVPAGDAEALAEALRRLLGDPALRRSLGRAARRKVEAQFNLSKVSRQLFELFEETAGRREGAVPSGSPRA